METERRLVRLADGRDIEYQTAGPADGLALVVHEGTPMGLVLNNRLGNAAGERGLRIVQAARPGYEGSTPLPGRAVADVVPDVIAVLDDARRRRVRVDRLLRRRAAHPGVRRARARALPRRPPRSPASPPTHAEGLDFLAGMGPENIEEFGLAVRGADALTPFLDKEADALRGITGEQIAAALGGLISGADAAVLTGEFAADLAKGLSGAVRNGIAGWRDDDLAFVADWGFGLDALGGRAAIWQGDQDNMVPFAHGRWLAAHIPGARAHLEPGAGHVTMTVTAIDRILDDLLDLAGRG